MGFVTIPPLRNAPMNVQHICKRSPVRCEMRQPDGAHNPLSEDRIIDDAKLSTEEMVRRDMEALRSRERATESTKSVTPLESAKQVISTVLLWDFFLVLALLLWLLIALVPHFASKNDFLLDPWLQLWQPFTQPVLGVLMVATIIQGTISYVSKDT